MTTKRPIPNVLWIALIALGVMVALQLLASLRVGPSVLLVAVLSGLLLWGLYRGHRWAYVVTVVLIPVNLVVAVVTGRAGYGIMIFMIECLVWVPVLLSTRYYWGRVCPDPACGHRNRADARFCARCGVGLIANDRQVEGPP